MMWPFARQIKQNDTPPETDSEFEAKNAKVRRSVNEQTELVRLMARNLEEAMNMAKKDEVHDD